MNHIEYFTIYVDDTRYNFQHLENAFNFIENAINKEVKIIIEKGDKKTDHLKYVFWGETEFSRNYDDKYILINFKIKNTQLYEVKKIIQNEVKIEGEPYVPQKITYQEHLIKENFTIYRTSRLFEKTNNDYYYIAYLSRINMGKEYKFFIYYTEFNFNEKEKEFAINEEIKEVKYRIYIGTEKIELTD